MLFIPLFWCVLLCWRSWWQIWKIIYLHQLSVLVSSPLFLSPTSPLFCLSTDALSVTDSTSEPHPSCVSLQQWRQEAWGKKHQVTPQALISLCILTIFFIPIWSPFLSCGVLTCCCHPLPRWRAKTQIKNLWSKHMWSREGMKQQRSRTIRNLHFKVCYLFLRRTIKNLRERTQVFQMEAAGFSALSRPLAGWKGRDSDWDFSGVTIWPGPCVCCCASAAWWCLQCWERGSRCGRWMPWILKAELISCIKNVRLLWIKTVCVCYCRFSSSEVLVWIHSLFFSLMSCVFLIQPAVVKLTPALFRATLWIKRPALQIGAPCLHPV